MKIIDIKSREILDSRGFPTIETDIVVEGNVLGRASIPSGASTGSNEALELRDNEKRYLGKGVHKAINNVLNIIKPAIVNKNIKSQEELDNILITLDGTKNKEKLGANAILSVSLGFLKACAKRHNEEIYNFVGEIFSIPKCMLNILNGGMHANNNLNFQEFMIVINRDKITDQLQIASEIFHTLKKILKENKFSTGVGDEGGFAPNLKSNEEALDIIVKAINKAGYEPKKDVSLALDTAANSFYDKEKDKYLVNNKYITKEELLLYYKFLIEKYPIISIEDPFEESDFESFAKITKETNIQIVGDDIFVTNSELLKKGIKLHSCNAILIKANQIGTITEMLETINLAKKNNYKTIISHRSGETEDTFIADLAVGLNLGQMKSGSISRGERICKYNRLIRIEEELDK